MYLSNNTHSSESDAVTEFSVYDKCDVEMLRFKTLTFYLNEHIR